ncbi:MAG: hypothetical protein IH986_11945 [Planctomycetes bacterium]|nr:hypothetical protein [Planctomycetota bacterium]
MQTSRRRTGKWMRPALVTASGGLLFQQGCAIDLDILLQAFTQIFTEFAIFVTDNALVALR